MTKKQIEQVVKENHDLAESNVLLKRQLDQQAEKIKTNDSEKDSPSDDKNIHENQALYKINNSDSIQKNKMDIISQKPDTVTTVPVRNHEVSSIEKSITPQISYEHSAQEKQKPIPYYTIPANATAVHDRLMTALVGRIPVKGVVTDPYPFKIVFSDDTLAANGIRVPNLKQMVVSGFTEGDLNLKVVRGWVTSLTFVFDDGTISSTTSNDNNIGKFTKENALGYLTDLYGNPIQGTLITNAPEYLSTKVGLGVASGFATAYAQKQVNNQSNAFGTTNSNITGSPEKFMLGQGLANGANQADSWFEDHAEASFDAIYVPTIDKNGQPVEIAVNFTKEIPINYDPAGRKVSYATHETSKTINVDLD